MALVTMQEVLNTAKEKEFAVAAFTVDTLEVAEEIAFVAEEKQLPAIMMVGQNTFKYHKLEKIASICRQIANSTNAPIVLHLDHGASYEQVIQCLRNGFTSVMIDGSRLSLDDNIALTKKVVDAAHAVGVSVEAELGAIGGTEDGMTAKANLVDVADAQRFLNEVTVEALAIGIGNAHGIYKSTPNLAFDRLEQVAALGGPALVLHGGSGIPEEMIRKAIRMGIRKINVATEVRHAFIEGFAKEAHSKDIYKAYQSAQASARKIIWEKMALFDTRK